MGAYLMGVHIIGVYLMGVHLIGCLDTSRSGAGIVCFISVYHGRVSSEDNGLPVSG
jgi:hypothetical protein